MYYTYILKSDKGFIALMSAIIISFILIVITITLGMSSLFGRFNILDSESKERSYALAEACGDSAILEITYGTYSINKVINIGPTSYDTCTIVKTVADKPNVGESLIKTQSAINKAYTNLLITIDSDYNVLIWEECTNFTAADDSC